MLCARGIVCVYQLFDLFCRNIIWTCFPNMLCTDFNDISLVAQCA